MSALFHNKYIINNNILPKSEYNDKLQISIKTSKDTKLTAKQLLILQPLINFYSIKRNLYILVDIIMGKSIISLRLIEYFVVNYVLKNKLKFNKLLYSNDNSFLINNLHGFTKKRKPTNLKETSYDNIFIVHDNYKSQLKQYSKRNFDPFCRSKHIKLFYDSGDTDGYYFDTTVAQLNFFKWAISNYILDYIIDNLNSIDASMSNYEKMNKKTKKTKLSQNTTKQAITDNKKLPSIGNAKTQTANNKKTTIVNTNINKKNHTKNNRQTYKIEATNTMRFNF
jgi:hypothetical protein